MAIKKEDCDFGWKTTIFFLFDMTQSVNTNYLKKKQGSTLRFTKKTKLLSFYQQTRYTCLHSSSPKNKGINCNINELQCFYYGFPLPKNPQEILVVTRLYLHSSRHVYMYMYLSLLVVWLVVILLLKIIWQSGWKKTALECQVNKNGHRSTCVLK